MKWIKKTFDKIMEEIREENKLDSKYKQSLINTNDVINIFWVFKQPINVHQIQLIKDWGVVLTMDVKSFVLVFCRAVDNAEKIHILQRYGLTKADCEEIKNSPDRFKTAFEKLEVYKGAYNKFNDIE